MRDSFSQPGTSRLRTPETALTWFFAVIGVLAFVAVLVAPFVMIPDEDALILFIYSRNLAHTGAITYITYGPHAEGATDFLWMVLIACGDVLRLPPLITTALINAGSMIGIPLALARMARRRLTLQAALFFMGVWALLPMFQASLHGFSPLPFALLMILAAMFFSEENDWALAVTCLLLCLFRPDGVVFAIPLMIAACVVYGVRASRLRAYGAGFVLPGIIYFLWRWWYFKLFFPLPFLVKSDTPRVAHLFVPDSVRMLLYPLIFVWILTLLLLWGKRLNARSRALALCLLVLPNLFYIAMRLDQNVGRRFYVYLPAGLAVLLAANWDSAMQRSRRLLWTGVVTLALFCIGQSYYVAFAHWVVRSPGMINIATQLDHMQHGRMLITEAGTLPYYSHWEAYDAWGLDTAEFARRFIQPSDVEAVHPDLMLVFTPSEIPSCVPKSDWQTPYKSRSEENYTRNVVTGASDGNYELWYTPFGSASWRASMKLQPWQMLQYCWFIRKDSPLADDMRHILTSNEGIPSVVWSAKNPQATAPPPPPTPPGPVHHASIPARIVHHLWYYYMYPMI